MEVTNIIILYKQHQEEAPTPYVHIMSFLLDFYSISEFSARRAEFQVVKKVQETFLN